MNCKSRDMDLMLYAQDELNPAGRAQLEAHLSACSRCRGELETLQHIQNALLEKPVLEPKQETLDVLRHSVMSRINRENSVRNVGGKYNGTTLFSFVNLRPALQFGLVFLFAIFGYLLGRFEKSETAAVLPSADVNVEKLLSGQDDIQTNNSQISPFLANIRKVQFNPETDAVEIRYNTVNNIALKGTLQDPVVREMLVQALFERDNIAVRLHAIQAIESLHQPGQRMDNGIVQAVDALLESEPNLGVRLQALRLLSSVPMGPEIKNVLTKTLSRDRNRAVRIATFDILTRTPDAFDDVNLKAVAQRDSSDYIRYRAKKMMDESNRNVPAAKRQEFKRGESDEIQN